MQLLRNSSWGVGVDMTMRAERRRLVRHITLILLAGVAAVLSGIVSVAWVESYRNDVGEYEVYSAYLSGHVSENADEEVVVQDRTAAGNPLRSSWLYPFDRRGDFEKLDRSTQTSFWIRNGFRHVLKPEFHLPNGAKAILAAPNEIASPSFHEKHRQSAGYVVLSGIGMNRARTQAVFYIDHVCGLCGGGRYVLMEKQDGVWRAVDEHWTWIS